MATSASTRNSNPHLVLVLVVGGEADDVEHRPGPGGHGLAVVRREEDAEGLVRDGGGVEAQAELAQAGAQAGAALKRRSGEGKVSWQLRGQVGFNWE